MATTYLDITNEVLRELNEVILTSANFDAAIGIQAFVKDAINKANEFVDLSNPPANDTEKGCPDAI